MTATPTGNRRGVILAGLSVVGVAAAILSFETLNNLAKAAGYSAAPTLPVWVDGGAHVTVYLSWLVPVAIDAFGLLATLAWLTPAFSDGVRKYAKHIAIGDIAGSAILNALYHGMRAADWKISECWPVVIGVGAIPPVMVALALHLGSLVMDDEPASAEGAEAHLEAAPVVLPEAPDLVEAWAELDAAEAPAETPVKRFRVTRQKHPKKRAGSTAPEAPATTSEKRSLTDTEAVLLLLEKHPHDNPSKRAAQTLLGVHFNRVGPIFELADQKRTEKHTNVVQMHPADAATAAN